MRSVIHCVLAATGVAWSGYIALLAAADEPPPHNALRAALVTLLATITVAAIAAELATAVMAAVRRAMLEIAPQQPPTCGVDPVVHEAAVDIARELRRH